MPVDPLRVAIAQLAAVPCDIDANVRASVALIAEAAGQGAQLVAFPELSLSGYEPAWITSALEASLRADDERLAPLRRCCRELGVVAVLGAARRSEAGKPRIGAFVVDAAGEVTVSDKQHLHGSEIEVFAPGEPAPPFSVRGWRVAVGVCFDAAKPTHAAAAAAAGADVYLVSALYVRGEERRLDLHLGARAMDNRVFSVLANYAGTTGGMTSCGLSGVWGPTGERLCATATADATLLVADLDPAALAAFRG